MERAKQESGQRNRHADSAEEDGVAAEVMTWSPLDSMSLALRTELKWDWGWEFATSSVDRTPCSPLTYVLTDLQYEYIFMGFSVMFQHVRSIYNM